MRRFVSLLGLVFIFLALALTPAGTEIRNQASASYIDSAGQPRTTTSNEVVTVVKEVYGLEITPNGSVSDPGQEQTMLADGPVYFHWRVKNTGNVADDYNLALTQDATNDDFDFNDSTLKLYHDENCNGQVDPGEVEVSTVSLAPGESTCVIAEAYAEDPSSRTAGEEGLINLEGTSVASPTTTDTDNWAQATITEKALLDATKSASPSDLVEPGDPITYTIEGTNRGGSPACAITDVAGNYDGILIEDEIPENTTFSRVVDYAAGAGTAKVLYYDGSNWSETAGATVTKVALLIEGSGCFFPVGAQYLLEVEVTVDSDVSADTEILNQALVKYDDDDDPGNGTQAAPSNETTNRVAAVYGVKNGPSGDPEATSTTVPDYTDPKGNTWTYEKPSGDNDAQRITNDVYGGDTVYFKNTLKNTGNAPDSYELTLSGVPEGWTCQFLSSDGVTPLSNPVGSIAAGDTFDYIVKCSIPPTYTSDSDTPITVTATSQSDPSKVDETTDIVPPVQPGYSVDIANVDQSGDADPDDDWLDNNTVNPGEQAEYPFEVRNTGNNPDTYDLTTDLPPGTSGTIYPDSDCDGQMDDPEPTPVSDTGLIDPGERKCFILVVDVPEGTPPITKDPEDHTDDNVVVTATSTSDPTNSTDTVSGDLNVNAIAEIQLSPDRAGTVTSPGTIIYSHTLTNDGNQAADVQLVLDNPDELTWTYQARIDVNGDGDFDDPGEDWVTMTGTEGPSISGLPAGESRNVEVRVLVPDGEPIDKSEAAIVKADATFTGGETAEDTATDVTTVVGGELRLDKSVDKTEAEPGEVLTYTIEASNIGTADLRKVIIADPLPGYTTFESLSATTEGFGGSVTVLWKVDDGDWQTTPPSSLSTGQSFYLGVDTNGDNDITQDDVMPPGAKITITFKVRIEE